MSEPIHINCPFCDGELHLAQQFEANGVTLDMYTCPNPDCDVTENFLASTDVWYMLAAQHILIEANKRIEKGGIGGKKNN